MKSLHNVLFATILALAVPLTGCVSKEIIRVSDGEPFPVADLDKELRGEEGPEGPSVVFIGEGHTSIRHHMAQLMAIRSLHESGVDIAIGVEMIKTSAQSDLDDWLEGRMSTAEFKKIYKKNWSVMWFKYKGIFEYARDKGIPMIGLDISFKDLGTIMRGDPSELSESQQERIEGIECDIDDLYKDFIREALEEYADHAVKAKGHGESGGGKSTGSKEAGRGVLGPDDEGVEVEGVFKEDEAEEDMAAGGGGEGAIESGTEAAGSTEAGSPEADSPQAASPDEEAADKGAEEDSPSPMEEAIFNMFCKAQVIKDTLMAGNVIDYMEANPGRSVVVLSGSAHTWKYGIPEQFKRRSEIPFYVILPEVSEELIPEKYEGKELEGVDTDYIWPGL